MGELSVMLPELTEPQPEKPGSGFVARLSRNIMASLARVAVTSVVALLLPAYLTHHLPVKIYAAWILILQLGAYVSYLDLGVQTAVSKFVAEYDAKGDEAGAGRHASAGLALMALAGLVGIVLTVILAWQVPRLFAGMPDTLYRDVRISVVLVGVSLSVQLVCSVFSAIFLGLQRYSVPMVIIIIKQVALAVVIVVAVMLHSSLAVMGTAVALVNVGSALLSVAAWRRMASRIPVSLRLVDTHIFLHMAKYCSLLSIWTIGMVCVTGMDVTIVGHYDYVQTAYYSIATQPTWFMIVMLSALLGPLMPASSAMSTHRSPSEMGDVLARTTRYCTLLLLLTGLPLIVCGFPILHLWVGTIYALNTLKYLRLLVLANIVRNLCFPYAMMIAATGRQGAATVTAISEAVVNLGSSIFLASRYGAIGVAMGTLLGSFVSIVLHFAITMHFTYETLSVSRTRLFLAGLLRPATVAIPSILILPFWWSQDHRAFRIWLLLPLGLVTWMLAWWVGLKSDERSGLLRFIHRQRMQRAISG